MGDGPLVLLPPLPKVLKEGAPPCRTRRGGRRVHRDELVEQLEPSSGQQQAALDCTLLPAGPEADQDLSGPHQLRTNIEAGWLFCRGLRIQQLDELKALGISLEVPMLQPTPDRSTIMGEALPLKWLRECLGIWTWEARLVRDAAHVFEHPKLKFLHEYIKAKAAEMHGDR